MLRLLVLALVLINGLYFAWSQTFLKPLGWAPAQQSEPQRLTQQLRPEAVRILSAAEVAKVEAQVKAELAPKECLQAGPFEDAEAVTLRQALESTLPPGSWQLDTVKVPQRWIIYMGKYPNAEALAKKRAELSAMNLTLETLKNPALEFGISLGGFETQAAANDQLVRLNQRGIRTARVVQERVESHINQLKLTGVSESLKPRLMELKPALAGKVLTPCP
jgi:hypothetical protein